MLLKVWEVGVQVCWSTVHIYVILTHTYVRMYVCIEISYDKFPLLLHLILVLFPLEVTSKCFQDM